MQSIKSEKTFNTLSKVLFAIYLGILVWVVMFKCNLMRSLYDCYNFMVEKTIWERFTRFIVPFGDYTEEMFRPNYPLMVTDDILNVLAFVPMGLYLTYFVKGKNFGKVMAISFGVCLFFELFQLFSLIGSFSTKDFITNMLGALLGYLLCKCIYKKHNSTTKIATLNVISIVMIVAGGALLAYAVVNTIAHFDVYVDIFLRRLA